MCYMSELWRKWHAKKEEGGYWQGHSFHSFIAMSNCTRVNKDFYHYGGFGSRHNTKKPTGIHLRILILSQLHLKSKGEPIFDIQNLFLVIPTRVELD